MIKKIQSRLKKLSKIFFQMHKDGFYISYLKFISYYSEISFDRKYNIETRNIEWSENLTIESENNGSHVVYVPSKVFIIRQIFKKLEPTLPFQSTFVDMGSGKGRIVLLASEFGFKKVKGVEFAKELYDISINNCNQYKKKNPNLNFQIVHSDVENYLIGSDENVFFMFNAFGKNVLIAMLDHIISSIKTHPRKIYIIYCYPTLSNVIEEYKEFEIMDDVYYLGIRTIVYQSK